MNVIAVRQDNNGDVLLAGPALRAIAAHASSVTLVCGPSGHAAACALPGIDTVIAAEAAWIEAHPRPVERRAIDAFVDRIAAVQADAAVVFTSFHQSPLPAALLLRIAGVPRISAISVDYPGALLDVRHALDDAMHEVERALSLAAAAGFLLPANDDRRLMMQVADANPLSDDGPYIVVHPGATVPARAWDPQSNRDVVEALVRRGERIVVTGSAAERELCAFVAGGGAQSLAGTTDFTSFARVVADADAIVCGNTGATHVAAAVGTPVVELFAPTIPLERFAPWMVRHVVLGDQTIACRGCRARTCPLDDQPCLGVVTIDDVLRALATVRRSSARAA